MITNNETFSEYTFGISNISYSDGGNTILCGNKHFMMRISVKGLSKEEIEKDVIRHKKNLSNEKLAFVETKKELENLNITKSKRRRLIDQQRDTEAQINRLDKVIIPF